MSILLDALKRSESQRELGSVPTLETHTDSLANSGEHAPAWLSITLVVLAAVLITWLGLQQFQLPDEANGLAKAEQQSPGSRSGAGEVSPVAMESDSPGSSEKSILPRMPANTASDLETAAATSSAPAAQPRAGREVRNYVAPEEKKPRPAEPVRENAVRQPQVASVEIPKHEAGLSSSEQQVAQQLAATQSNRPADNYEPEIISYWQVPEEKREGLPDLRISVLVFAEQAESRFLLLNGERMREGEELPNGLQLEEIRRDRAIFNYRNYRFYLKS